MCPHFSRRDFIITSATGSVALMAFNSAIGNSQSTAPVPVPGKGSTKIYTLYLGGQDPKWPSPNINHEAERRRYEAELRRLVKIWRDRDPNWEAPIEFIGGELLTSVEQLDRVVPSIGDSDGLLVFPLSIPDGGLNGRVLQLPYPLVFYFASPSTAGFMGVNRAIQNGTLAEMVYSSDLDELAPLLRIIDSKRRLKETKILLLSNRPDSKLAHYNPEKMHRIFGVNFKELNFDRINALMTRADTREAERLTDEFIKAASGIKEPSRAEVVEAHKFYLAVKDLLAEESAQVITIDCLPGFYSGQLSAYPCVAWTRLMDEGLTGVCEADAQSTLMSLILQYYTGKPGFVSDPFFDTARNTISYAHCVAATRLNGVSGKPQPYIIRSHMEDNKGVSIQVKMPVDQVLTTAQILDCDTVVYHTARVIDNSDSELGCRTKPVCKIIDPDTGAELKANKLLHDWQGPWHKVSWFGNHVTDLQKMSRLMGFKLVREV